MKTIKVDKLAYNTLRNKWGINIEDNAFGKASLDIDFKRLLPFANLVNKDILDFFILSAAVYGIDRFMDRKHNSVDGWSRNLNISFPVHDLSKWNNIKEEINRLLSFLTGDYWNISFRKEVVALPKADIDNVFIEPFAQINLLSGGLDSLIGAIDFLQTNPKEKVLFVSHYDPQMHGPKGDQEDLILELNNLYPNQFDYLPSIRVSLEKTNVNRESTFRSRSLLFIGLALMLAESTKTKKIVVPENGTVSLNFPLSSSRRSSCSTRTTHPFVFENIISIWKALSISTEIQNPYELQTKGEMVSACKDQINLSRLVKMSNSCGKRGHRAHWQQQSATHCGVCMPCVYRQASLFKLGDNTNYGNTINSLVPFQSKKSQDISACLDFLNNPISKDEIRQELIINGIKNVSKLNQYVDLIWRTRDELKKWFSKVGNTTIKTKAGI